jgi:hypothetical protein
MKNSDPAIERLQMQLNWNNWLWLYSLPVTRPGFSRLPPLHRFYPQEHELGAPGSITINGHPVRTTTVGEDIYLKSSTADARVYLGEKHIAVSLP